MYNKERLGKNLSNNVRECADFLNFVEEMELIDFPYVGVDLLGTTGAMVQ